VPELTNKVAIVTGAARGTGAAIARRFVEEGARVVLGDLLDEPGEAVAREIGDAASYRHHDVTRAEDWEEVVAHAQRRFGGIDVLVNNAGVLHLGTIETTSGDVLRRLLEVNTVGPYLGMRAVIGPMRARGGGSIVQLGSIDSLSAMNGITSYCASKWGLRGMSRAAALELGRDGIRVNSVCPSGGSPQMYGPWFERLLEFVDQARAYTEDRAIPGEVPIERIADAVVFFASDRSARCTGVDLPVDGGAHAGHFIPGFNTL
jgi:3alpha(or 20beta)-hydroxysteroid dehydrogenase